nr:MAG TPA: hypothetical protein [Bacteriophage sp.]
MLCLVFAQSARWAIFSHSQVLSLCLSPQQERPNPQRDTRERPEEVPRLTSVDHEPDQLKTGKTSPGLTSPVRS